MYVWKADDPVLDKSFVIRFSCDVLRALGFTVLLRRQYSLVLILSSAKVGVAAGSCISEL